MSADNSADINVFETVPGRTDRGKDISLTNLDKLPAGQAKTWFFEAVKRTVQRFNKDDHPADKGDFPYIGLYHPPLANVEIEGGKVTLKGVRVNLDEDYFKENGKDYSDLQDVTLFHEAMELYYVFKPGKNLFTQPEFRGTGSTNRDNFAHFLAMVEEYRYAALVGKAEKFKEFYQKKLEIGGKDKGSLGRANTLAYEIVFPEKDKEKLNEDLMENYQWLREKWEEIR